MDTGITAIQLQLLIRRHDQYLVYQMQTCRRTLTPTEDNKSLAVADKR